MTWGAECNWCGEKYEPLSAAPNWSAMICAECVEIVRAKFKPPEPAKVVDLGEWRAIHFGTKPPGAA
jgi:hypothetical protein